MSEKKDQNIYNDIFSRLGNIEGKLDRALHSIDDQSKRINNLEKIQDQMVGKVSVISAIFGFVGGIVVAILKSRF